MTEEQIRRVFWKGLSKTSRHVYRRLRELEKAGFLRTRRNKYCRNTLYQVTQKGCTGLRILNESKGLKGLWDTGYATFGHDLTVTDIRILFHEAGYSHWLSERILAKNRDLRQIPDGMILKEGHSTAIEYESSRKSKLRYREIIYNYEFDNFVQNVLYVVNNNPGLALHIAKQVAGCTKLHFVLLEDLQKNLLEAPLVRSQDNRTSYLSVRQVLSHGE